MTKVLLNGATRGTNFGDFLFAKMFQEHIAERVGSENVAWYTSKYAYSAYYKKYLENSHHFPLKETDALVYISGGYFGGNDKTLKQLIKRYLSYFSIGVKCAFRKIPYAIIGVEVAASRSAWMNAVQKFILRRANVLTVRNEESFQTVKAMGIENVLCTADSVFAMPAGLPEGVEAPSLEGTGAPRLLVHMNPIRAKNEKIIRRVVPVVNRFLKNHPEYHVVLACDQHSQEQRAALDEVAGLIDGMVTMVEYHNPLALCRVIEQTDVIVTTKLHVGIVGAKLGKSVVSFSGHTEKIQRLYSQLGESGRTCPLDQVTEEQGLAMLEEYHLKPICVSRKITEAARENFARLDAFLDGLNAEKAD